ncbi:MAG: PAS domain S-box protein [Candidatus Odinarchaeota archaeon]
MINNNKENNFEKKWRSLIEHSPERIITLDRNGIVLFINRTPPNMTVEEAIGKSVYNFLPTDEQKKLHKILHKVFETGKPHKYIGKIINNNGSEVWYECSIAGIKDNGQVIAAIINSIDITELKLSEIKLKKSEEKYRNLINNLNDAVVEVDFEGPILYISPQITRILGYTPDELIGTNGYELIHQDDYDRVIKIIQDSLKAKIPIYYEEKAKHKDGHYVPISVYGTYLKEGDKGRIIGIARNNSEIKEMEQKLREAEEKYRIIFEKSSNAIVLIDLTGKIIECNSSTVKIFGYSKEELIGKNYLNLPVYSENMKATLEEGFKRIIKGNDIKPQKLEIKRKDEKLATIKTEISYIKIRDQNFFKVIIQDITEQKKAEEDLKESEEKFRIIAENSLVGIIIIQNNIAIYANGTLTKITEYPNQKILKWSIKDMFSIVHPDDRERAIQRFEVMKKKNFEDSPPYPYRIITKSGRIKWIDSYASFILFRGKEAILASIIDITENKQAELKLKKFMDSATDSFFLFDEKLNLVDINKKARAMIGLIKEEIIGKNILELEPNIRETDRYNQYLEVIKTGKPFFIEDFRPNPRFGDIHSSLSTFKVGDGLGIIATDITKQKKIEQELRESEEKFRNIAEQALMGITIRQEGVIKYCNNRICEINGYSSEEIKSWEPNDFIKHIHPEDREFIIEQIRKLLIGDLDAVIHDQFRTIKKDGEIRWLETFSKRIIYEGCTANLTMSLDITDKIKAEQNLKESEEKFRTIADQSLIGIDITQDGKMMYVNNALSTIVEYTIEEIRNWYSQDYYKLIHPDDLSQVSEDIAKIQDGDTGTTVRHTCRIITKNKKVKWVEVFSKLILYRGKRAFLSSTIDITTKMEAEKKLKEINHMKSELLRRTSHELKTPLVSIKGFSDLLLYLHSDKLDLNAISLIDEINQGCFRLENLIKDILKTSELDLGKMQLKRQMEDLAFLINFSIKELRGLAEIRRQTIEIDIHDSLVTKFEKERIHEVLGNLIMNAIKYTPTKGHIKIQTEIKNGFYIVSVKDDGIGLTNKEKSKLFTQFGKIEHFGQGLDVISDGSGLGLYISKKIIELHGGEIWVDSEGRNKGSTFYFSLPIISN